MKNDTTMYVLFVLLHFILHLIYLTLITKIIAVQEGDQPKTKN